MLYSGAGNFSLCHGLAGNAEVLREGHRVLGQELAADGRFVLELARVGQVAYASHVSNWPLGVGIGVSPSLMTGLAGVGYFYLRLYNPSIPSMIMPRVESFLNQA